MASSAVEETDWKSGAPRWLLLSVIGVLAAVTTWASVRWIAEVEAQINKVPSIEVKTESMQKDMRRMSASMGRMEMNQIRMALYEAKRHRDRSAEAFWEERLKELERQH
jgi:hypothetical protein